MSKTVQKGFRPHLLAPVFYVLATVVALAATIQMGPKTNYSAAEITASLNKTNLAPNLKQYTELMGGLGRFESSGNTGINNGSCCTGIGQINETNLRVYAGMTPQQYANLSLDKQTEIWAKVTNVGANASSVKQLQAMGKFDGREVDGSMILACIQLGTGNCQKMIDSGHCNGWHDGMPRGKPTGTNICQMADKMRERAGKDKLERNPDKNPTTGQNLQPNEIPEINEPLNGTSASVELNDPGYKPFNPFDPQSQGTPGTMTKIGDPTVCWVCDAVGRALGVTEKVTKSGIAMLMDVQYQRVAAGFVALALAYMFMRAIASGSNPFGKTLVMFALRVTVVMAMFSSGDFIANTTNELFISAPIEAGSEIGKNLGEKMATSLGFNREAVGCSKSDLSELGVSALKSAGEGLIDLSCTVHVAASTGILAGGLVSSHPTKDATVADKIMAMFLLLVGLAMMYLSFIALLNFGFALMETVIVTGIIAVFMPVMLLFYMFDSTKDMIKNAFENVLFVFINLVFAAIGGVLMVYVMMMGMSLGLSDGGSVMTAQEIVTAFAKLVQGQDITQGEPLGKVVKFGACTVAGFMLASRILQASQSVAMEISGHTLGQAGAVAKAGSAAFAQGVKAGMVAVGTGATVGGRVVGAVSGKAVGAAFTSGVGQIKASGAFTKLVGGIGATKSAMGP